MKFTVKSPIGTDINIDLENSTLSVPKIGLFDEPILDWGVTHHEGENVQYARISGNKNLLIGADYLKTVVDNRKKHAEDKLEAAVPGITLLQEAHSSEAAYFTALEAMMGNEMNDGVNPPKAPELNTKQLSTQYPRAALYIKADAYSSASHYAKSAAGNKAKKLLEDGGSEEDASTILDNWLPKEAYWD